MYKTGTCPLKTTRSEKGALHAEAATWGWCRRDTAIDSSTGDVHNIKVTHSTEPSLPKGGGCSKSFVHIAQNNLPDGLHTSMLDCTQPTSPLSPIRNLGRPEARLFLYVWRFWIHAAQNKDAAHQRGGTGVVATQGYCHSVQWCAVMSAGQRPAGITLERRHPKAVWTDPCCIWKAVLRAS